MLKCKFHIDQNIILNTNWCSNGHFASRKSTYSKTWHISSIKKFFPHVKECTNIERMSFPVGIFEIRVTRLQDRYREDGFKNNM